MLVPVERVLHLVAEMPQMMVDPVPDVVFRGHGSGTSQHENEKGDNDFFHLYLLEVSHGFRAGKRLHPGVSQPIDGADLNRLFSRVAFRVSRIRYHVSGITCHVSRVTYHHSLVEHVIRGQT
jgi:hypothetical protein